MGKNIQVCVFGWRGEMMVIDLCNTEEQFRSMTVRQLKEKVVLCQKCNIGAISLAFHGKLLDEDSRLLCEYGVQHQSVIQVVRKVHGGGEGPLPPDREDGGMGDKDGRNKSMEKLSDFDVMSSDL